MTLDERYAHDERLFRYWSAVLTHLASTDRRGAQPDPERERHREYALGRVGFLRCRLGLADPAVP